MYNAFYKPYLVSAVKCADLDAAMNSLYASCYKELDFEKVYRLAHQLFKKDAVKLKIS